MQPLLLGVLHLLALAFLNCCSMTKRSSDEPSHEVETAGSLPGGTPSADAKLAEIDPVSRF